MTRIDASYQVVTPMFCGGASPGKSAELRLPSFKGVLRFWWRALAWERLEGDLQRIWEDEASLFGSSDTGQSRVVMRFGAVDRISRIDKGKVLGWRGKAGAGPNDVVGQGARYLGYGVMGAFGAKAGQLNRPCLRAPFGFTVQMLCRGLGVRELASLRAALIALGTLGGMGAKSRKGYGSLVLRSLDIDGTRVSSALESMGALKRTIRQLHAFPASRRASARPQGVLFTALTGMTRHVVATAEARSSLELLDLVGREMVRFRAWGHNGRILGTSRSEKNFREDHDLMTRDRIREKHPERIAFGLPHNYGKGPDRQVGPSKAGSDRRASPLFIHMHVCGVRPVAVLSLLPSKFLSGRNPEISVGRQRVPQCPDDRLYRPIHEFLDRLSGRGKPRGGHRKERFTDVQEVDLP